MNYFFTLIFSVFSIVVHSQVTPSEDIKIIEISENSDEVPFMLVERVPIYKGCDESQDNAALKKCMADGITQHVSKKFNIKKAQRLGLPDGTIKIIANFKINPEGKIVEIEINAPHEELARETERVIQSIPNMEKPGYVKGKPVTVPYTLPIIFKLNSSRKRSNKSSSD